MSGVKTSDETAASALGGTELVRGVQSAANVKITIDQIKAYIQTGEATLTTNTFTGAQTIASGTLTASAPALTITQTWNNLAVTFTASFLNITDTTSGPNSLLADWQVASVSQFKITKAGRLTLPGILDAGYLISQDGIRAETTFLWPTGTNIANPADGIIVLYNNGSTGFSRLPFGGTTSSFPSIKRNLNALEGRLADDSAFCSVKGKLTTDTNATTGLTAGVLAALTNASIVVSDGAGQAYRIPCII